MTMRIGAIIATGTTKNAALAAVLLLCFLTAAACTAQKTENVILITYDGLRWQELFGGLDERLGPGTKFANEDGDFAYRPLGVSVPIKDPVRYVRPPTFYRQEPN